MRRHEFIGVTYGAVLTLSFRTAAQQPVPAELFVSEAKFYGLIN